MSLLGSDPSYSQELQDKIDHAQIEGWKIHTKREDEVVMVKRKRSSFFWHIVLIILTSWWTLGVGNLLYWLKCRYGDAQYLTLHEYEESGVEIMHEH